MLFSYGFWLNVRFVKLSDLEPPELGMFHLWQENNWHKVSKKYANKKTLN